MTDDPKVADHGAGPPAGPGRTLGIDDCFACPMSVVGLGGLLYCEAEGYVTRAASARLIRPEASGRDCPPPGWCPLRGGPVTLEVRG